MFLLLLGSLLLQNSVQADSSIFLQCITSAPTTSFLVETTANKVNVRMINHNGLLHAPTISGVFTPADLPSLAERAALVQKLGEDMVFQWDLDKCKKTSDFTLRCVRSRDLQDVNGTKISPLAFSVSKTVDSTAVGIFQSVRVRLDLEVNGKAIYVEMPYYGNDCRVELPSNAKISGRR